MTSDACRELRAALGAVALGGADPAEALALRAHLDGCPECRAELRELTSVAAALPLADPWRARGGLSQPPPTLAKRVLGRVAAERTARRTRARRRFALVASTSAAIAAAVVAFVLLVPGSTASGSRVVFAPRAGVSATATLHSRAAGTEVAFHVAGLDRGDDYWLWLTGDDGHRIAAGTLRGTGKPTDVVMTAAIPLGDARRIWVTDANDKVVLDQRLPAPAA
jgi:anti-sigma factor RsiW